jgi:hypothetical protein
MIQKTSILGVAFVFLEVCTFGSTSNSSALNNDTTSVINDTIPSSIYNEITTESFETQPVTTTLSSTLSNQDSFKLPDTCSDYKVLIIS